MMERFVTIFPFQFNYPVPVAALIDRDLYKIRFVTGYSHVPALCAGSGKWYQVRVHFNRMAEIKS
jgi:hypothetical protein